MYKYFKWKGSDTVCSMNMSTGRIYWEDEDGVSYDTWYYPNWYQEYVNQGKWLPCDEHGNLLNKDKIEEGENMLEDIKVGDKLLCLEDFKFYSKVFINGLTLAKKGETYKVCKVCKVSEEVSLKGDDGVIRNIKREDLYTRFKKLTPKQKLPHKQGKRGEKENWVKTITLAKYNRCIEKCEEVAKGVYLDRETSCAYLMCSSLTGYYRANPNGIPTRIKLSGENGVEWYLNSVKAYDNFSKAARNHKSVIGNEVLKDPFVEDKPTQGEWTDKHYDFNYKLTPDDIEKGYIRVDAYFVNRMWKINSWDDTGAAFHNLKTFTRIGNGKNSLERELKALYKQTKKLCELHGIDLEK